MSKSGLKYKLREYILRNHPEWLAKRVSRKEKQGKIKFSAKPEKFEIPEFLKKGEIIAGPFKGMSYGVNAIWSEKYPKIIGTYELELFPFIEDLPSDSFDILINIGAAEGFFGVALARKLNIKEVVFVDPLEFSHASCKQLAKDNSIDHYKILNSISTSELNRLLENKKALLFVDCEGGEAAYLNPKLVPNLKNATVIAEIHDFMINDLTNDLAQKNKGDHKVTIVNQTKRNMDSLQHLSPDQKEALSEDHWLSLMDEKRPRNLHWLVLNSK